jgi:hypothetical protein
MGSVRGHYFIESMLFLWFLSTLYQTVGDQYLDSVTLSRGVYFAKERLASSLLTAKMTVCKYSGCGYAYNTNTSPSRDYWL